jgi:hypothetical protein
MRYFTNFSQIWLAGLAAFSLAFAASSQTIITPATYSGTWTSSGSPYMVVENITVPAGQTLTIGPGVEVVIGAGVSITANGLVQAVGSPTQRIKITSPISSEYYDAIYLYSGTGTNLFEYCDFAGADNALYFYNNTADIVTFCTFQNMTNSIVIYGLGNNYMMPVEIMNCTFSNCFSQAIYGTGQGQAWVWYSANGEISPVIKNCAFCATGNGCVLDIVGNYASWYENEQAWGWGLANAIISQNIFQNLSGSALLTEVGSYAYSGTAVFMNNTVVNCSNGVSATDPWNVQITDNIFVGATNAVTVSGSLSQTVSFNDFYNNATNFTGYPLNYGVWVIPNRNGTLADILLNISEDPLFAATNDFHLQTSSPCIDAGTPDPAFAEVIFPPAQGTSYPDLGAYGGLEGCNWLDVVPGVPVQLSLSPSNSLLCLNWTGIPRSSYQIQYLPTSFSASGHNQWLSNSTLMAVDQTCSMAVSACPLTNSQGFYRIKSLGRLQGD